MKNSFTLIEILVCLILLSMAGSVVVYKGWQLLRQHKFSHACETLTSEVELSRVLALTYQIDIDLILEQKGKTVRLIRKTDFIPTPLRFLFQEGKVLSEVAFREEDGVQEIHFYGNGWIAGEENIQFYLPQDKKKEYTLPLKRMTRVDL